MTAYPAAFEFFTPGTLTRKGRRIARRQHKRTKLTVRVVMTDRAGGRQTLRRQLTIRPR